MKNLFLSISFLIFISLVYQPVWAQLTLDSTLIDTTTIASGLHVPWEILWGSDDHIWITERNGNVSRLNPETRQLDHLLKITEAFEDGEGGLLGMALHPDFESNPYVYVVYSYLEGCCVEVRLVRYTFNNNTLESPWIMLDNITGAWNHNGSRLIIASDTTLYMTTGDAANTALSQDWSSLNGKVLRINLDGSVPDDNPIPGSYLWSWGLRNSQGLVQAPNGIIYSSEHGPSNDDELNIILKGRNYGWPNVQGYCNSTLEIQYCADSNIVEPIMAWTPTLAVCGLDYYPHAAIPEWQNTLLLASLKERDLRSIALSEDGLSYAGETIWFDQWFGRLRDLCVAPDGRVFLAVSNNDGRGTPGSLDDRIVELKPQIEYCFVERDTMLCTGNSIFLENEYRNIAGTFYDTITAAENCDTVLITHLEFMPTYSLESTVNICMGDSVFVGGAYQKTSGEYMDTYVSFLGCDSVINTTLIVSNPIIKEQSLGVCPGDSVFVLSRYIKASGTYFDTIDGGENCDTIIQTYLFHHETYDYSIAISICEEDSIYLAGAYRNKDGSYVSNLISIYGCDSIVTYDLTVTNTLLSQHNVSICPGDSAWINGRYLKAEGSYFDTLQSDFGCDSVVQTNLNFYSLNDIGLVDTVEIKLNETYTIRANSAFMHYEWNNDPTLNTDTLWISGNKYGVGNHTITLTTIDFNNCSQYDESKLIIEEATSLYFYGTEAFTVYPNPLSGDILHIKNIQDKNALIQIRDNTGKLIQSSTLMQGTGYLYISLPKQKGVFIVNILTEGKYYNYRVIKL
jgi:glucose/arabinose dehydrogenase